MEVFNKTVKKYLASFIDESTLNWQDFLPALMLAYNTSYHSTIATTPFERLFGVKPRLPSLPAPDIEWVHYGESFAAERLQILQHACKMAHDTATEQGKKYKLNYDVKSAPHKFKIGQKIFLNDTTSLGKNYKLYPNWTGPYEIIDINDINDNNAKIKIKNKLKVVNITRIKPFLEEPTTRLSQDESSPSQGSPSGLDQGHTQGFPHRPMTRAFQKLQDLKNAASLAIAILTEEKDNICYGNIFDDNYNKYHCQNCYKGIQNFLHLPNIKELFKTHYVPFKNVYKRVYESEDEGARAINKQDQENLIKMVSFQDNDADPRHICPIKEELHQSLLSVASKLLTEQHLTLDQLSKEEQDLWNSYDNSDIYEFLTGEKDTLPEFQFDWIVKDPKLCLPHDWKDLILPQPQPKQPQGQAPPAPQLPPPLPAQIPDPDPPELPQPLQVQQAPPAVPQCDRVLHNKPPVDYKELHTGIKRKCKTLRRKATAVVTKLAPGAFSPRRDNNGDGPPASTSAPQL